MAIYTLWNGLADASDVYDVLLEGPISNLGVW